MSKVHAWSLLVMACTLGAGCTTSVSNTKPDKAVEESLPGDPNALVMGAELALERKQYVEAARAYSRATQLSDDETLAEKATRVAYEHEQVTYVLASAERWLQLNATNEEAQRFAGFAALRLYKIDAATEHFTALLQTAFINPQAGFLALLPQLMEEGSRPAVSALLQRLTEHFPDVAEAQYALAQAALQADNTALALTAAQKARELSPYWSPAGLLLARAQLTAGNADAAVATARSVVEQDGAVANRLEYAILLLAAGQDEQGRAELDGLATSGADSGGAERALALLDFQMGKYESAAQRFERLLSSGRFVYESLYHLGAMAERRGQKDEAIELYSRVIGGEYAMAAQARAARLKLQGGSLDDGLTLLQDFGEAHPEFALDAISARASLLAEAGQREQALTLLDSGLEAYPDAAALRFSRAFLLVEMDRVREAIDAMQALVRDRPDDPAALNALGYTLVDRTHRYKDGYKLIEQAHAQTPDSGAVLDSMGWALYRMGEEQKALDYLQKARDRVQDPDVNLHLGDVLWALGRHAEAREAWQLGAERYPEDAELSDRLKKRKAK